MVCKDRSHRQGGVLLIFIHGSITFSKQPSSPEALSDPHLEELSIKDKQGNTKLMISNVYIPPDRSRSEHGYMEVNISHSYTEAWQGHLPRNFLPANLVTLPSRKSPRISAFTHNHQIYHPRSRPEQLQM